MLTIQNVRKDVGTTIGDYVLSDCGLSVVSGLSIVTPKGDGEYYSFYWKNNLNRTFKFLLDREPVKGKPSIYRIRLYDTKLEMPGTNRDGFVVETHVGKIILNDRIGFYGMMIKTIEQYM
jgi:hypothetical protein